MISGLGHLQHPHQCVCKGTQRLVAGGYALAGLMFSKSSAESHDLQCGYKLMQDSHVDSKTPVLILKHEEKNIEKPVVTYHEVTSRKLVGALLINSTTFPPKLCFTLVL